MITNFIHIVNGLINEFSWPAGLNSGQVSEFIKLARETFGSRMAAKVWTDSLGLRFDATLITRELPKKCST